MARLINRDPSVITREVKRNCSKNGNFSVAAAHEKYKKRRLKCRKNKKLDHPKLKDKVKELLFDHWGYPTK